MVKRCSAKNCYNSQLTHKVSYFGYPKNEIVARQWAELAGRDDLKDKRLQNLTKYYLCSDHFAPEAFVNPDVEDKSFLRLNRLLAIPLPSIFEDNLMKNVQSVTQNPDKFVNYTKNLIHELPGKKELETSPKSFKVAFEPKNDEESLGDKIEYEDEVEYIDEELEISKAEDAEAVDINDYCRLCGNNSDDLIPIFTSQGDLQDCFKLMPRGLISKDDGLPQFTCDECLSKLQSCANIIDGFVMNQNLFVSE